MTSPFVVELSPAEKLAALRTYDRFRHWSTLDEERVCLGCGQIITGTRIRVVGPAPLQLQCPTEGCHAIAMDWVLPRAENTMEQAKSESTRQMEKLHDRASQMPRPSNALGQVIGALLLSHFR